MVRGSFAWVSLKVHPTLVTLPAYLQVSMFHLLSLDLLSIHVYIVL